MTLPHVVIVGGGFGGLSAAKALADAPVRITLVDRRNHHLFQPLLYQVATAGLNPADIAYPIRSILRSQANVQVILGEVVAVDATDRAIVMADGGRLGYDTLVLAAGAGHSYFGRSDWERMAPGLKTIEDAVEIRRRVLSAFEAAERTDDPEEQRAHLTFVVVGAGPTGVEMAGAIAEIAVHTLKRDFRSIDPAASRIVLLEGGDRVLPAYSPKLSASAEHQLEKLGVEVRTGALVTDVDADGVQIGDDRIAARTVVWGAGVAGAPVAATMDAPLDRAGRVEVEPDLSVPGHREILVIGDLAAAVSDGAPVPGVAPAAMQGGDHAAAVVLADLAGEERPVFRYKDKGSLATIGRSSAVASFGRIELSGFVAWVMWWAIHIAFLIGFRSRTLVMFSWGWSWLTFQRGARLITDRWRAGDDVPTPD